MVKWQLQDLRIHVLLKLKREEEAIEQLDAIKSPLIASRAAASIAANQIESGDVEAGLKMAERIGDEVGSGDARGTVAIALLQHADRSQATKHLNQLSESDDAMSGVVNVARHWVEHAEADRLLTTFESLHSPVARTHYAISAAEFLIIRERANSAASQ